MLIDGFGTVPCLVYFGDVLLETCKVLAAETVAQRRARHAERVHGLPVAMQLEMQVRTGRQAAAADEADHLALTHTRAAPDAGAMRDMCA